MADAGYHIEMRGSIAVFTLNRPQTLNTFTPEMMDAWEPEWRRLGNDPNVRVVVLTGTGRGFSAGIDLSGVDMTKPKQLPELTYGRHWIAQVQQMPKPTIAAINGVAAGGGLGLALACDIRVASDQARFGTAFSRIGMPVLDGVGHTLVQAVGLSRALEMIYTAEVIDVATAERIGLVSHVYPHAELMDKTFELAERIAAGPPLALGLTKHAVYNGIGRGFTDYVPYQYLGVALNSAYAGNDIVEGGLAFKEKRKPKFRGPLPEGQS
jgi:2-(1,2-epoxy-1,2-dihydrophenyl)acetyl-CoA isomerase